MPRNSSLTIRRLGNGASAPKGKNGKFLRVSVHKTTRKVEKVQPNNWTEAGNTLFTQLYPEGLALKTRRKKQQPTMVTVVDIPAEEPQAKVEEEKEDCCICYSEISKARTTLECGHSFCTKCILTWFQRKNTCPMCRAEVKEVPPPRPNVERVHIDSWHGNDIIDLTNRVLNGEALGITSSFTNTYVGFRDIYTRYRTGMLRRNSRQSGGNGYRFAQAMLEVTNRLAANVDDEGYNRYFTSNGTNTL